MTHPLKQLLPLVSRLGEDDDLQTLADLAAADGRSRFHLQRVFSRTLGESPLQYRRRVRLQRAAARLLTTERSILDLALEAGYDSHEGFTRAFRTAFGLSPREFRRRRSQQEHVSKSRHLEIASRTAPCVGLYRVALETGQLPFTQGEIDMSHEIKKRSVEATPFLFVRTKAKQEEIASALESSFGAVFQYATTNGIAFAGPPTARYANFGPGFITIEAGMPVAGDARGEGDIELGSLFGGEVATTIHKGPYDQLSEAHQAIESWLAENSEQAAGGPWESYVTDPGEVPDPADWETEVNWPLA